MNEEKKNYKKKLLSAFAVLMCAGFVFAAWTVVTTNAKVEIREPFEVSYAMLGDGSGMWDGISSCFDPTITWLDAPTDIDFTYIYAGEERTLCVKVNNLSEADLAYDMEFSGLAAAQMGISNKVLNSPVLGQDDSISVVDLKVKDDAEPSGIGVQHTIGFGVTRG